MHQELFHFSLPVFLSNLFGVEQVVIYSYAFFIVFGAVIATVYTKRMAQKVLDSKELPNTFFYLIFVAGFVGGKLFYYLEKPDYYLSNPNLFLNNFSGGFVFYGSFVTIIPVTILYLKRKHIPVLPMLDIFAFTTIIVHAFGRIGCFLGGCCYGKPTHSSFGIIFPSSNQVKVHPTQLYEVILLVTLFIFLLFVKSRKNFDGQLFLLYISLYAGCRYFLEFLRGDDRGYIIKEYLSHSQFIGLLIILTSILIYKTINTKHLNKL